MKQGDISQGFYAYNNMGLYRVSSQSSKAPTTHDCWHLLQQR